MSLKLMYITNRPEVARIVENAGVDRVFVDMEYIGKMERQCGMDTVQLQHTVEDVVRVRKAVSKAQLMVRVNPIHEATKDYCDSEEEINNVIEAGADMVMLPYFQSVKEVSRFIEYVDGRAIVFPLLESAKAIEPSTLDEILNLQGIDEIHIGLNDLSLDLKKKFMFELLADGTVEKLCRKIEEKGIPYGFGGIASLGKGILPSEYVIGEHYRLGSQCAILSRSFCDVQKMTDLSEIADIFDEGIRKIRAFEKLCVSCERDSIYLEHHREDMVKRVEEYVRSLG